MTAIRAEALAKSYLVRTERRRTLKELLLRQYTPPRRLEALHDVSFAVEEGETFAVVGANGSGKSTLLKLIAGTARPTAGRLTVNGRISALLELGAGFHPDFTGRENVFLNAALLGLSRRETERVLPEIEAFAELGDFFDAAVKTYSSGMYMRLAFAVAAHVDPDVLLIDEILAVGDEYFQRKCFAKLNEFRARSKTICFVSHDLNAVGRLCRRGILLEGGRVRASGDIALVLEAYAELVEAHEQHALAGDAPKGDRWGSGEVRIERVVLESGGRETLVVRSGEPFAIRLGYEVSAPVGEMILGASAPIGEAVFGAGAPVGETILGAGAASGRTDPGVSAPIDEAVFGVTIYRDDGVSVYGTNTQLDGVRVPLRRSGGEVTFRVDRLPLLPGRYELDVAAASPALHAYDYHSKRFSFRVSGTPGELGTARIEHRWEMP